MNEPNAKGSDISHPAAAAQAASGPSRMGGRQMVAVVLFVVCLCSIALPEVGPPIALAAGIVIALLGLAAFPKHTRKWSKMLIQVGVVLLGFRMDLHKVLQAGLTGVAFALGTIVLTFGLGILIGRLLAIDRKVMTLVSSGTAICGGSAIAATGSVIAASEAQIAVAMGCVFILNSIALYAFPPLGEMLHLTVDQFGTWGAVAIHDISSVVGAAAVFDGLHHSEGTTALETAMAVKLSRTLWIAPISLVAGWWFRKHDLQSGEAAKRKKGPPIPWFIGLFLIAALASSVFPQILETGNQFGRSVREVLPFLWPRQAKSPDFFEFVGKKILTLALLLIGMGMSRKAIASVGWRAMVLAVSLWIAISVVALVVVRQTI